MTLLVRPARADDEGPCGFRSRLALANALTYKDLFDLDAIGEVHGFARNGAPEEIGSGHFNPWVQRYSRFCPRCVEDRGVWRLGWELLFADACPACGLWLVDTCSECGKSVTWNRQTMYRCDCGQYLGAERCTHAPHSVVTLSVQLQTIAMGQDIADWHFLKHLSLAQFGRLVRLLGCYGNSGGQRLPQKIPNLDSLGASWPVTTVAAEILATWPNGLFQLLDTLKLQNEGQHGRMSSAFRGFYVAMYKSFKDPEFGFLREAFEEYIADRWTGAIGKRNRRLAATVMESLAWVPANHACSSLGISRRRLNDLIDQGQLRAKKRLTKGNRSFIVVLKADVEKMRITGDDGVSLVVAAERLGLSRQRLLALLPIICPEARKLGEQGCPWAIPTRWLEEWNVCLNLCTPVSDADSAVVLIGHLIKYWPWRNDQIGALLLAIKAGKFANVERSLVATGISGLAVREDQLRAWFTAAYSRISTEMTLPALATHLGVKQEVVYSLTRAGFLQVSDRSQGRRSEQRVSATSLATFERQYVFCNKLAAHFGRSSRAVASFLKEQGVNPVAGPGVDGCRQLVFERLAVETALVVF